MDDRVRPLQPDELPATVDAVARAFADDPMFRVVFPGGSRRRHRQLRRLFTPMFRHAMHHAGAFTTEDYAGGALLLPPAGQRFHLSDMVRAGLVWVPLRIGPAAFRRFSSIQTTFDRVREQVVQARPCATLLAGGVIPQHRGRGLGRALMQARLDVADRLGLPTYLETVVPGNVELFRKFGFETRRRASVHLASTAKTLPLWAMLREPGGLEPRR
ncbi:MAG: GNAT family N-acetyltransferase [Myxococcota bacterium]